MQPLVSTYLFVKHRLTTVWLERIWDAGFPAVELFCARQHIDYRDKAQINELGHWFRDSPLKINSVHAPVYSDDVWGRSGPQSTIDITDPMKARRMSTVDEIKRALEIADLVPFRYFVLHLGIPGEEYDDRRIEAAFSSLEEIKVFAGQRGVQVLLENIPNALSSAERLNDFLAQTHLNLGYSFDIGHAHMHTGVEPSFEMMKKRIKSVHIHDNNGKEDQHLFPGQGTIDWPKAKRLLSTLPEQCSIVLDVREPLGVEHIVDEARRAAEELMKENEQQY